MGPGEATVAHETNFSKQGSTRLDTLDAPVRREADKGEREEGSLHLGAAGDGAA
jgi:hypothetical protein